jgi:hypothetical protein
MLITLESCSGHVSGYGLPEATREFITAANPNGVFIHESQGHFYVADRYGSFTRCYNDRQAVELAWRTIG